MNTEKSKVIAAAQMALLSDVGNLTNDRVEALSGGHGMVNIAIHCVANVITDELLRGASKTIEFADVRRHPVEDVIEKAIAAARRSGADGANAALLVACMMYIAGSAAQVGIPAGNRKLGATCRMLAGVDRSGVSAIPTPKMNNKISAFPAVLAINQALMEGKLTSFPGKHLPDHISGTPILGHSALGEDYIWPEMAEKGAIIGTQAMMDAMSGAAITPHPFTAATLGAAAILEIIHSDAEVPEGQGVYGRTTTAYLVGKTAAKTAGLPEKLHMRVTGDEYETAKIVGDVGLILKDIGAPSVIGMMAMAEVFACFEEGISGSIGLKNGPLGHVGGYAVIAMKAMLDKKDDIPTLIQKIRDDRINSSFDAETALVSMDIIVRKATAFWNGPITRFLLGVADPAMGASIYNKASYTYDQLQAGKSISEIVAALDKERQEHVEGVANRELTRKMKKQVKIEVLKIKPAARRTGKLIDKYWSFDPLIDVRVTLGKKTVTIEHLCDQIIPQVCQGKHKDLIWAVSLCADVIDEFMLAGCNILNAVVPVAVAAAMEISPLDELATQAEKAGYISAGIPGTKKAAKNVGEMAAAIVKFNDY